MNKIKKILYDLKLPATKKEWIQMDNYIWDSEIIDKMKKLIKDEYRQDILNVRQKFPLRQSYDFSIVKKGKTQYVYRAEEAFERFITISNQTNNTSSKFGNQFNIKGKKQNIDLVKTKDDKIISIYEIKDFDGSDNPIYAAVELLKNEMLLLNTSNARAQCLKKVVLAPKEYFALHVNSLKTQTIKNLLAVFAPIEFTYVDIKKEEFNKTINSIGNNLENEQIEWQKKVNAYRFEYVKKIHFKLDDIEDIKARLQEKNWQTINSLEIWPRA
jgi:hypothetical protein